MKAGTRKKVILLDIDGCVNNDRSAKSNSISDAFVVRGYSIPLHGDFTAAWMLNQLCNFFSARIIISSDWLEVVGPEYTRQWLIRSGLKPKYIGGAITYGRDRKKASAIRSWLVNNSSVRARDVVIVDDDDMLFDKEDPLFRRQVVIDGDDGICARHYKAIFDLLAGGYEVVDKTKLIELVSPPVSPSPGQILREEFMVPLGLTEDDLVYKLRVDAMTVKGLLDGSVEITAAGCANVGPGVRNLSATLV